MRLRLKDGQLRVYAGTEEKFESLTIAQVVSSIMKRKDGWERLRYAKQHGLWLCINSINTKRRRFEPHEIKNNKNTD
jgi:hypothetical protein